MKNIRIVADYNPENPNHRATERAIAIAARHLGTEVDYRWVGTTEIRTAPNNYDALWFTTGVYQDWESSLTLAKYAREAGVPTLGTCSGFQHLLLEIGRNVLQIENASHAEHEPYAPDPFISQLSCSLRGRMLDITLRPGSMVNRIYGFERVREKYFCNFGVDPQYVPLLQASEVSIVGSDDEGVVRVIEIPAHRFFIATLYVPQHSAEFSDAPHPLVQAFVAAAVSG